MPEEPETRHLVVTDDHAAFRRIVCEVAQPLGWEVHECSHGQELDRLLQDGLVPDLILLDVHMPESDGIETLQLLASKQPGVPIAIISGADPTLHDATASLAEIKGIRVLETLRKPISVKRLRELLA